MKSYEDLERVFNKGLKEWQNKILEREANKIGMKAMAEIKRLTPVDTGTLRRRWYIRVVRNRDDVIIYICNNTEYAAAVNYGRRISRGGKSVGRVKGRYMLERGIYAYRHGQMESDVQRLLQALKEKMV